MPDVVAEVDSDERNSSLYNTIRHMLQSGTVDMIGRLHVDIFFYMLNEVSVRIKLGEATTHFV